jgi:hypothetical protein
MHACLCVFYSLCLKSHIVYANYAKSLSARTNELLTPVAALPIVVVSLAVLFWLF